MKILFFTLCAFFSLTAYSSTLAEVIAKDELSCGVSGSLLGFSKQDDKGKYNGFDVDYCRAVAAAAGVSKVKFINLTAKERLIALKNKEVDILSRTTTWTLSRDTDGFDFVGTIFYDGEGFMVPTEFVYQDNKSFVNSSFCLHEGTTSSENISKYFTPKGIKYHEKVYPNKAAATKAYLAGDCQIYVLDTSALMSLKASLPMPEKHKILAMKISKEPLSPVVRDNDAQWLDITRWTLFLLFQLEENGINQLSLTDTTPLQKLSLEQQVFMRSVSGLAWKLGLDPQWGIRIAASVGSYETIFQQHFGDGGLIQLPRGLNALWRDGGLLYSPPFI